MIYDSYIFIHFQGVECQSCEYNITECEFDELTTSHSLWIETVPSCPVSPMLRGLDGEGMPDRLCQIEDGTRRLEFAILFKLKTPFLEQKHPNFADFWCHVKINHFHFSF